MELDLTLAAVHHLAVFAVFGILFAEFLLLRLPASAASVHLLARVDMAYGLAAVVVLAAGAARVVWGAKGPVYYLENPVFWVKLGLFIAVGVVSVLPTLRYLLWTRRLAATGELPGPKAVGSTRRLVHVQLGLFALIPIAAAMMARGIGA